MKKLTILLTLFVAATALPVAAQTKPATPLNTQVARAVAKAVVPPNERDPQLLVQAETLLQQDRDAHEGHALHTLDYYYNQLKQAQTAPQTQATPQPAPTQKTMPASTEYEPGLLYRAEELLQQDCNAHGGYAVHTLDYYYQQLLNE